MIYSLNSSTIMSEDSPALGIPGLRNNPFQARPLERGRSELLVGRDELSARWTRFIKARNARMVLLIGESGTGRSSLMRCLSEETQKSVHLDMFPDSEHAQKILHEIFVSFVGFEVPSSTPEMVSRLVQETEKSSGPLPLISLDYANVDGKKLSEVLSTLVAAFERMNALVVVVLSTEQRAQWPTNLVSRFDHVDIIGALERDEVRRLCESRMATTANISWTMSDGALDYVMENTLGNPSRVMRLMRDLVDEERANPREVKFDSVIEPPNPIVSVQDSSINNIDEMLDEEMSVEPGVPIFDLNLDKLEEEPETIYMEDTGVSSTPVRGPFSGLAARNRDNKNLAPRFDKTKAKPAQREPVGGDANELWLANEPNAVLAPQSVPIVDEPLTDDQDDDYFESKEEFEEDVVVNGDVEGLLGQLFEALNVPDGLSLAELLAGMRRPVLGRRESNALDVHTLRNLSKNEAVLVEVSSTRELSPSDSRLQDRLKIGRPRMSQMCNRLYRAGILSVQQRGRSRMFKLTNDARAQMVAWGIMEASV